MVVTRVKPTPADTRMAEVLSIRRQPLTAGTVAIPADINMAVAADMDVRGAKNSGLRMAMRRTMSIEPLLDRCDGPSFWVV